jgi:hypothetical protein
MSNIAMIIVEEEYRKRTIYIPARIDKDMRLIAATVDKSYSQIAIEALEEYISKKKKEKR